MSAAVAAPVPAMASDAVGASAVVGPVADAPRSRPASPPPCTPPAEGEDGLAPAVAEIDLRAAIPALFHLRTEAYPAGNRPFLEENVTALLQLGLTALAEALQAETLLVVSATDWELPEKAYRPVAWRAIEPLAWLGTWLQDELRRRKAAAEEATRAAAAAAARSASLASLPPMVAWVIGGPGSGRAAACDRLAAEYGFTRISVGDLLRAEVAAGTPAGVVAAQAMAGGDLVDDGVIIDLLRRAMMASDPAGRYLIDGFPRSRVQAEAGDALGPPPDFVIHLDTPGDDLASELNSRGVITGRNDTNPASIARRLEAWAAAGSVSVEAYDARGLCDRVTMPSRASRDDVYSAMRSAVEARLFPPPPPPPTVIFVVGGPGAGKSTHCSRLAADLGYVHVSTGDVFRAEVASGSPTGVELESIMREGKLVPFQLTMGLLRAAVAAAPPGSRILIDGFPRALDQGLMFEREVAPCERMLHLTGPLSILQARLMAAPDAPQDAVPDVPPPGSRPGSAQPSAPSSSAVPESGPSRVDDNPESIAKRFATFEAISRAVIEYYAIKGKVRSVDATGTSDEVYALMQAALL